MKGLERPQIATSEVKERTRFCKLVGLRGSSPKKVGLKEAKEEKQIGQVKIHLKQTNIADPRKSMN